MPSDLDQDALGRLPTTFRYSHARSSVNERTFRDLLAQRSIGDDDLIEIAALRPRATLCLRTASARHDLITKRDASSTTTLCVPTALPRHDLIDDIPAELDIAAPWHPCRGHHRPVATHEFDPENFTIGRLHHRPDSG